MKLIGFIISQNHTLPVIDFRIAYRISLQTLMSGIATPQLTCVSCYASMVGDFPDIKSVVSFHGCKTNCIRMINIYTLSTPLRTLI